MEDRAVSSRWWFVRHGESEANAAGWLSGHRDVDLTARGVEQALALRSALVALEPGRVLASDLRRAWRTAELAWGDRQPPVERRRELRERDLGRWTGVARRELEARGWLGRLYTWNDAPPGGESQRMVAGRVLRWLTDNDNGADTLVFAHGALIRCVVGLLDERPTEQIGTWTAGNGEVIGRAVTRGRWRDLLVRLP